VPGKSISNTVFRENLARLWWKEFSHLFAGERGKDGEKKKRGTERSSRSDEQPLSSSARKEEVLAKGRGDSLRIVPEKSLHEKKGGEVFNVPRTILPSKWLGGIWRWALEEGEGRRGAEEWRLLAWWGGK